jgi:hypothetical protein
MGIVTIGRGLPSRKTVQRIVSEAIKSRALALVERASDVRYKKIYLALWPKRMR